MRDALLSKVSQDRDLLSIGSTVAKVAQLASDSEEAVHDLAYFVLSDIALTQKVLRLANTVFYRPTSGSRVTTVSRAIFLLGFDIVKTSALAMLLVDGLANKEHAQSVRAELMNAVCASVLGRELARNSPFQAAEEAAIAALFKNLGRVLVALHDHAAYNEIMAHARSGKYTVEEAALRLLGCTFESLTESVLESWKIPETITQATGPLPSGYLRQPQNRQEWMQQIAAFSAEAGTLILRGDDPAHANEVAMLHARFGASLNLGQERIHSLLKAVKPEISALASSTGLKSETPHQKPAAEAKSEANSSAKESELPSEILLFAQPDAAQVPDARHPDGKPVNARERLLNGIQDVTMMMASGRCKLNELMLLVLETLYCGMGFRFATLCLKDHKTGQFRARVTLGEKQSERQAGFVVSGGVKDIFNMAVSNDVDLMISDATAPSISSLIPDWHRALLPDARSFILLSLVVNRMPVGFYYADRIHVTPEGIPADETALIKILKGQVLSMMQKK